MNPLTLTPLQRHAYNHSVVAVPLAALWGDFYRQASTPHVAYSRLCRSASGFHHGQRMKSPSIKGSDLITCRRCGAEAAVMKVGDRHYYGAASRSIVTYPEQQDFTAKRKYADDEWSKPQGVELPKTDAFQNVIEYIFKTYEQVKSKGKQVDREYPKYDERLLHQRGAYDHTPQGRPDKFSVEEAQVVKGQIVAHLDATHESCERLLVKALKKKKLTEGRAEECRAVCAELKAQGRGHPATCPIPAEWPEDHRRQAEVIDGILQFMFHTYRPLDAYTGLWDSEIGGRPVIFGEDGNDEHSNKPRNRP